MRTLIVNKDGSLAITEVPKPVCGPKTALVRTIACGMCGTDVKLIHHAFKGFPKSVYPIMLGHEGVGEVVEIGADVRGLKIGDKVLLPFVDADPKIYGDLGSGYGSLCEYAIVHDLKAYATGTAPDCAYAQTVLPDDLNPVDAVMLVTFREVLSTIRYFGIKSEHSIVVFGCGPVGLTYIKFLKLLGCQNVIAVDIADEKLEFAQANGATKTINSTKEDLTTAVRAICPDGVHFTLDAVGLPIIATQSMPLIADRGTILCYGVPATEEITLDFSKANYNWNLVFQQMPRKIEEGEAHEQVLQWIREDKLAIKDFISDYFEFDNSVEAYNRLLDCTIMKKGIITF